MRRSLAGNIVVVTGASSGVGRATVRELAERGALLALVARGEDGLAGAHADVDRRGSRAVAIQADVSDHDQVEAAAERVERDLGPIDVWINVAMTSVFAPLWEIDPDEFKRTTEVTYLGYVYGTMAALRRMRPRDRGTIVQIGSALAYRGIPLQSAYCGAKHAIQGFHESLRSELMHAKSNIDVTMVQLPGLNTPQFDVVRSKLPNKAQPVPPIFQPEVAARGIVWAAEHPRRREIWVGRSTVKTIVGNKFFAGIGDRYLARTGFRAQQTDEPESDRPDNLMRPVPGDRGAHGSFDQQAKARSPQLVATTHLRGLAAGALLVGAAATAQTVRRR